MIEAIRNLRVWDSTISFIADGFLSFAGAQL